MIATSVHADSWPVPLKSRPLAQRRLIRGVIDEIARRRGGREPFGRIVRVVHVTAATALPADFDDHSGRRRLLHLCQARLEEPRARK